MRAVAVVAGTLVAAVVMFLGLLLAGLRWQVRPALDAIRRMNRSVTNPRVMRTAGTSQTQTSVVEHAGRNSGRSYQTPIDIIESPTGLLIALPYGTRADWLRNVVAAGTATVVTQGRRIDVGRPTIVSTVGVAQFVHLEKS